MERQKYEGKYFFLFYYTVEFHILRTLYVFLGGGGCNKKNLRMKFMTIYYGNLIDLLIIAFKICP